MTTSGRVLVLSPIASHPADQGNSARIQTLATELKEQGLTLDLFYYGMEGLTDQQRTDMEAFWHRFHFMPSLPHPHPSFARHWGIDDWCPAELRAAIHALHAQHNYDAILVNYVWMSRVLDGLQNIYRIIDTHDIFGDRHLISIREGLEPRWFFTSLAEEEKGFARADLLIGIQQNEAAAIRARVPTQTITVGHLMPPVFLTRKAAGQPIARFGYLGSGNPWNVKSVVSLDEALGPGSEIDWLLAGSVSKNLRPCSPAPYLLGRVAELEDFYRMVDCVVNPMMGGTGLKIKTVEALSFGKPVIGTQDAFEGMPARHQAHQLKDAAACAEMMRLYQQDAALRDELRLASRIAYLDYMIQVGQEVAQLRAHIFAHLAARRPARPQTAVPIL